MAQTTVSSDAELAGRIESSPALPFTEQHFTFRLPSPDMAIGPVSGVASNGKGTIYIMQRGSKADPILAFDRDGRLLFAWGKHDFVLPHSVRVDAQGNVWAVDAGASSVIKYSAAGVKLLTIVVGEAPDTGSPFRGVTDVAFAPNGDIFISDGYGNSRVLEYSPGGSRLRQWGNPGTGAGEFHLPHAIQISSSGVVYVADRENGRIEKFDMNGRFLGTIDHLGRCYALKLDDGKLWASISPLGRDPGAPGWLVMLDPKSGKILGHLDVPDQRQGHAIDILPTGEPAVTAGTGIDLFVRVK